MVRVVIAGGPYSGKSTLVKELHTHGFDIIPEAALRVIETAQRVGNMTPWEDRANFQAEILRLQTADYHGCTGKATIFDRGFPDGIAYYWLDDLVPNEELVLAVRTHRYDLILMPDLLPEYNPGVTRGESLEVRERVHTLIKRSYEAYGYEVVAIPVMPSSERIGFVRAHIEKLTRSQT